MTSGTNPSTRSTAVAVAAKEEAPRGLILGAAAVIALAFVGLMGLASNWQGGAMFAVLLCGLGIMAIGVLVDDDRGARVWVRQNLMR